MRRPAVRQLLALTAICAMLPDRLRQFVRGQTLFVRGKLFDQAHRDLVCRRTRLISVLIALSIGTGLSAGAVLSAGTAESIGIALRGGIPGASWRLVVYCRGNLPAFRVSLQRSPFGSLRYRRVSLRAGGRWQLDVE